jgi:transposase InsO family protein
MDQNEEEIRKEAIRRYVSGEKPSLICDELKRSKFWLFKWLERYKTEKEIWYQDKSRAPLNPHRSLDGATEYLIMETRKKLEATKYSQIGAVAICWEILNLGIDPPPIWTINRVLKRSGLTKSRPKGYQPKGKSYPKIEADMPDKLHQADLLGPRYLASKERFYSLNIMDIARHKVKINSIPHRNASIVADAFIGSFKTLGIPKYMQIDNQQVFSGSERRPRWLSRITKLFLAVGIEPIFIPFREPWRNSEVERFNDVWDKQFFRSQYFESFLELKDEEKFFEDFHNNNHRYSVLKGLTPSEFEKKFAYNPNLLDESFSIGDIDSPRDGKIHFIRFIRSDLSLSIFGESFTLDDICQYEYVTATIHVNEQVLRISLSGEIVKEFRYIIPKR